MAYIPKKVIERFYAQIGKYQRILQRAKDQDINEANTMVIVGDILVDVFGYDRYQELTREYCIKGTYCDLAIKIHGKPVFLLEGKHIGTDLKENQLKQAVDYGANLGVSYIILTNGVKWNLYKIKFERPLSQELICNIDFLVLNPRKDDDQQKLYLLCNEGISKAVIEDFHERVQTVNRFVISTILLTDPIVDSVRREIKKISPNVRVENNEIIKILQDEVLKREVVEGEQAEIARSRVKKAAIKFQKKVKDIKSSSTDATFQPPPSSSVNPFGVEKEEEGEDTISGG